MGLEAWGLGPFEDMHMRRMKTSLLPLAAAISLAVAAPVLASEKRPLPDAAVAAADGSRVSLPTLTAEGHWLVIVVSTDSTPSARLVAALKEWQAEVPHLADRAVLVFAGPDDRARQFVTARGDEMPAARWLVDADGSAAVALRVTGTPTIIGVADGRIEWVLAGVLNDPKTFQKALTGWVQR